MVAAKYWRHHHQKINGDHMALKLNMNSKRLSGMPTIPFMGLLLFLSLSLGMAEHSLAEQNRATSSGEKQLDIFFAGLETMQAEFVQTLMDDKKRTIEESEGILSMQRPNRFRIEYQRPFEQLYVADGKNLWLFDKELEQVTVRPQDESFDQTPAQLLSGTKPLSENFYLEDLGVHEGLDWLELRPKQADANFDYIRLALENNAIRTIETLDGLGHTTRLFLSHIKRNPKLAADSFKFVPPVGIDVIGEGE
jgi:outer membrane lipoprotein carrier protein